MSKKTNALKAQLKLAVDTLKQIANVPRGGLQKRLAIATLRLMELNPPKPCEQVPRCAMGIRRELYRVSKEMDRAQQENRHQLHGAHQALCWALKSARFSPSQLFAEVDRA